MFAFFRIFFVVCSVIFYAGSSFAGWPAGGDSFTSFGPAVSPLSPSKGGFGRFVTSSAGLQKNSNNLSVSATTSSNLFAAPAPWLTSFTVVGITSSFYNPQSFNSPEQLNWDIVPANVYSFDVANPMKGDWIGFAVYAQGYPNPATVYASYKGTALQKWPQIFPVNNSQGTAVGWYYVFYCVGCTGGGQFEAQASGLNGGGTKYTSLYVY